MASVDSFQGLEANIVLLSLVRSNISGRIGFLRQANRVCVALSRARWALYIVGNVTILKDTFPKIWNPIVKRLKENNAIGEAFPTITSTWLQLIKKCIYVHLIFCWFYLFWWGVSVIEDRLPICASFMPSVYKLYYPDTLNLFLSFQWGQPDMKIFCVLKRFHRWRIFVQYLKILLLRHLLCIFAARMYVHIVYFCKIFLGLNMHNRVGVFLILQNRSSGNEYIDSFLHFAWLLRRILL